MGREFALQVIDNSQYAVVSLADGENKPYGVPLSVVRDGDLFYFHSATQGAKVGVLSTNQEVCITFVGEVKVPDLYSKEQLDSKFSDPEKGAKYISSLFTTEFESAMVFGRASLVENKEEAVDAMRLICEKYTPDKMDYFNLAIETSWHRVNVYRVVAYEITAKRKKHDSDGVEMKWQRME